jgi:hypothetical protein
MKLHCIFIPVILATWEAEIRKITVQDQPGRDPISKITRAKWTGVVVQVGSPDFKLKSHQKNDK